MKEYYARLPFGLEQRLNLGFGPTCPICEVKRGDHHQYGCMAEECPKCHRPIVDCYCECLEPWEEIRISMAIEKTFSSLDEAFAAGAGAGKRDSATLTPTDKGAIAYVLNNVDEKSKAEINKGFFELFPDLKPCGVNAKGEAMYSAHAIADVVGMDRDEASQMAKAMLEGAGEDENMVIRSMPAGSN